MKTLRRDNWIQAWATEREKELLRRIAEADGDANMSATVRRLIRDEAQRKGITVPPAPEPETAAQAAA